MKPIDPLTHLQQFVKRHTTQKAAASALGISGPYLGDLLKGRRDFSDEMLDRLGLTRKTMIVVAK